MRIFSELEADELFLLDITQSRVGSCIDFRLLEAIASEAFMPIGYGGGVNSLEAASRILRLGYEKIIVNSVVYRDPTIISRCAEQFGSQAVVLSIDVKQVGSKWVAFSMGGTQREEPSPLEVIKMGIEFGAGEVLITSIDREGTWTGLDIDFCRLITREVSVPVVIQGGVGSLADVRAGVYEGGASAVAVGSLVVFQKENMGVLVNHPSEADLRGLFAADSLWSA